MQEKGSVHAEVQAVPPLPSSLDLPEEISQERKGGLAIVNIPRAILHAKDLSGLGEVGSDGIVAGDFAVMRVESPEGSLNGKPGGDDRSIDIDGECTKRERFDRTADDLSVDRLETSDRCAREVPEPTAESTQTRQPGQSTEPLEEKIAAKEVEVTQSPTTDDQESQHNPDHGDGTVVAGQRDAQKVTANPIVEANGAQVANEKLEACVGTQARLGELDVKIVLDKSAQRGFSISHSKWPFVVGLKLACISTFSHSGRLFASMNHMKHQYL